MRYSVFRTDGSHELGLGHVMRCLAFADRLARYRVRSVFVTKALDRRVTHLIRVKGYQVETFRRDATVADEIEFTRHVADRRRAKVVVTDLCHDGALKRPEGLRCYHDDLRRRYFTVCITSANGTNFPAHLIVSPYVQENRPRAPTNGKVSLLLGPSYAIFRREFIEAHQRRRQIMPEAKRILVTMGGSDEQLLTLKVIRALLKLPQEGLSVRIILGPAFSDGLKSAVHAVLGDSRAGFHLLSHNVNVAGAMLRADLAITSDGLTKYETMVTGTPSMILSRPESGSRVNEAFERCGTTRYLGDGSRIRVATLADEIRNLLRNVEVRRSMSKRGRTLVDGKGLERIIRHLPEEVWS